MTKKPAKFWKSIGGYHYCVQVRGRWHFVGSPLRIKHDEIRRRMKEWFAVNREQGFTRVGSFPLLEKLYRDHGATISTLQRMPEYRGEVES